MQQPQTWTIGRILQWTAAFFERKQLDSPRFCAELLLAHVLHVPRIKLYTDYERPLVDQELATYRDLVRRAGENEPIAYLTGKAHFFSLEFTVRPGVLIPRPDTETLVETALSTCRHTTGFESPRILDLCTGTGCIAAAMAHSLKTATITAVDLDPIAIEVAAENFAALNLASRITLLAGDLFAALAHSPDAGPYHLILSNPPYIASAQIAQLPANVRDYEPHRALDGGPDGLCFHRRILEAAPDHLLPAGRLMLEIAYDQGQAALDLAARYPRFTAARIVKDAASNDRVLSLTLA